MHYMYDISVPKLYRVKCWNKKTIFVLNIVIFSPFLKKNGGKTWKQ